MIEPFQWNNMDDMAEVWICECFWKELDTPPKFNSEFTPQKMDGWKTILSFWEGNFSGAILNFRWVYDLVQKVSSSLSNPKIINHIKWGQRIIDNKLFMLHPIKLVTKPYHLQFTLTSPKTKGWIPKKMLWKRWTPLKHCHFWYLC